MAEPIQTAVILAAGMGTRLEHLGSMIPKGFLQFGNLPIIEESILKLRAHEFKRIVIVTGHLHSFYDALRERYPDLIATVHNPLYEQSGSMYSLWCAREFVHEDFLLLESDIVYEDRALSELLAPSEANVVLLSDETDSSDPVYVETDNGLLVAMSKDRGRLGPEIAGELVGVSKISLHLLATMSEIVEGALLDAMTWHYEEHGLVAAARRTPVHCKVVPGLLYSEIDDQHDIAVTRAHVLPKIVERDRQWRRTTRS